MPENPQWHRLETGGAAAFWSLFLAAVSVFHLGLFLTRKIAAYGTLVQAASYFQLAAINTTLILFFEVSFSLLFLSFLGVSFSKILRMFFELHELYRKLLAGAIAGILLFVVTGIVYRVNVYGLAGISGVSVFFKYPEFPVLLGRILKHLTLPLGEELFFRGVLFTMLSLRLSVAKALILSSLLFSASHLNLAKSFSEEEFVRYIGFFLNGCAYCLLFKKYKNLFPSIAAHSMYNLLTSLFYLK